MSLMARISSLFQSSERFVALEEVLRWLKEILNWLKEVLKWLEAVLNLPPNFKESACFCLLLNFLSSNNFLQTNLRLSLVPV